MRYGNILGYSRIVKKIENQVLHAGFELFEEGNIRKGKEKGIHTNE